MQITKVVPLASGVIGLAALLGAGAATAQSQRQTAPGPTSGTSNDSTIFQDQRPGLPPADASQNTRGTNNHEIFRVLGFSGQIAAPVTPSYNDQATYQTFAGQPGRGETAIMAQSIDGAP